MFIMKDNSIVNVFKMPKSRNLDAFQQRLRVQIGKRMLLKHNVQPSNAKLRLLGVWNLIVNDHNQGGVEGGEEEGGEEGGEEGFVLCHAGTRLANINPLGPTDSHVHGACGRLIFSRFH